MRRGTPSSFISLVDPGLKRRSVYIAGNPSKTTCLDPAHSTRDPRPLVLKRTVHHPPQKPDMFARMRYSAGPIRHQMFERPGAGAPVSLHGPLAEILWFRASTRSEPPVFGLDIWKSRSAIPRVSSVR